MPTDTFDTPHLTEGGSRRRAGHDDETATTERGPMARPVRARAHAPGSEQLAAFSARARAGLSRIGPRASRIWARLGERGSAAWSAAAAAADGLRRRGESSPWCSLNVAIVVVWSIAVAMVAVAVALAVSPLLGIMLALAEGVALGLGSGRLARLVTR